MGVFAIRQTATGYRFDLKADNGQIIASSEVYATLAACRKGIQSVKVCCCGPVEDLTEPSAKAKYPKYEMFTDRAGQYRFRLRARNGKTIATSEGYTTKAACVGGVESVCKNAPNAETSE